VHDISSVPLVRGEFAVRWKFQRGSKGSGKREGNGGSGEGVGLGLSLGLNGEGAPGLLSRVTRRAGKMSEALDKYKTHDKGKGKGKAKEDESDTVDESDYVREDGTSETPSTEDTGTISSTEQDDTIRHGDGHTISKSSATISPALFTLSPSTTTDNTTPSTTSTPLRPGTPLESSASARSSRGTTEFHGLRDHGVTWEHAVEVVVQIPIDRHTNVLLDDELKLVVMQVWLYVFSSHLRISSTLSFLESRSRRPGRAA
jgi:hypothetical protein